MAPSPSDDTAGPFRLLFVCTGNTCRSPLAEALARRKAEERGWDHLEVASAGAGAMDGAPASPGALGAAARNGLDLEGHRSRALTPDRVADADLVLTMSVGHLTAVEALGGDEVRASLLSAFAAGREGEPGPPVPDPYGGGDAVYDDTYRALDELVTAALDRLAPGGVS